jgi:hypothetical protein
MGKPGCLPLLEISIPMQKLSVEKKEFQEGKEIQNIASVRR